VHNVSDVRQIAVHMAEPLAPGPSSSEVEIEYSISILSPYVDEIFGDHQSRF
jgi:hypothetical protein